VPETWVQATVVLGLVVPGFVYQASAQAVAGPDHVPKDFGTRVLRAVVSTAAFASIYALVFGSTIVGYVRVPDRALDDVAVIGVQFVVLALLVPWLAARVRHQVVGSARYERVYRRARAALRLRPPFDSTPSAWDYAFGAVDAAWVRVQLADGRWLGGWYGEHSFASSFPHPQELFVEVGWLMTQDGTFGDTVQAPDGMVIRCSTAVSVDITRARRDTDPGASDEHEDGAR
jgi:hypothetical protein